MDRYRVDLLLLRKDHLKDVITLRRTDANGFKEAAEKLNVSIRKDVTDSEIEENEKVPCASVIIVELLDQKEYKKLIQQYGHINFYLSRIPKKLFIFPKE